MNETSMFDLSGPEVFAMFHSTPYVWWAGMLLGFSFGLYRYIRSLTYLYCFYIEHGYIPWSMDNRSRRETMQEVIKTHKLYEHFTPHGYVSGLGIILLCTGLGTVMGGLYPITTAVGILTIPNLILRWLAKEKQQNPQSKEMKSWCHYFG